MGCFGRNSDRLEKVQAEHQWDFINLSDFTASSFLTPLSYGILYISLAVSIACYVVDIFTCSQLLLFDKWSGQIEPIVPLCISRWVFTGCILLSLVLLGYRWWRALRAMRTGGITQSYLDPLAVRLQSVRMGKTGRGWRRFLVFAELTKSRKGVEYVALFTYFSFEAWMRIVFAEGPRQAINAMTLAALLKSDVIPIGDHAPKDGNSPAGQFFVNLQAIGKQDTLRATVLFGMMFTVIIWIIAFISLIVACILWLVFLWHHIPSPDSGLRKFCKRKIEGRLRAIVDTKVKKALAKEDMKRAKDAARFGDKPLMKRQPTLPQLDDDTKDKMFETPSLSRQTTVSTLPEYTARPPNHDPMPTLPSLPPFSARPQPTRTATQASQMNYASNVPAGNYPGAARSTGPHPSLPGPGQPLVSRSLTGSSSRSQPPTRPGTAVPFHDPVCQSTGAPQASSASRSTPRPYPPPSRGLSSMSNGPPHPQRQNTQTSVRSYRSGSTASDHALLPPAPTARSDYFAPPNTHYAATHPDAHPPFQRTDMPLPPPPSGSRFVPYTPKQDPPPPPPAGATRKFSAPTGSRGSSIYSAAPSHDLPLPPPPRYGTAPPGTDSRVGSAHGTYDTSIFDAYAQERDSWRSGQMAPPPPQRSHTAGPGSWF